MHSRQLYLSTFLLSVLGSILWITLFSDSESLPLTQEKAEVFKASPRALQSLQIIDWREKTKESLQMSMEKEFAESIAALGIDELLDVCSEIEKALMGNSESTEKWLKNVVLEMMTQNHHQQAVELLDIMHLSKVIPPIERMLYSDWIKKVGSTAFFKMLEKTQSEGRPVDHKITMLASLHQNEFKDQLDDYIHWLENSGNLELERVGFNKIVTQLHPEHVEKIGELIERNIHKGSAQTATFEFILKHSPNDRKATMEWIKNLKIPDPVLKSQAYATTILAMALEDPSSTAEIMNAENYLPKYFPGDEPLRNENGDWSKYAKLFFDITLRAFINGAIVTDPLLARNSAESFFDIRYREEYIAKTNDAISRSSEANSNSIHHDCPSCQSKTPHSH